MSHYTVLADQNLNKTFWYALQKCNLQRKTVLHLGKSALLAIFAIKAGAKHVYICNSEKNLALLIEKTLSLRERKKITLLNKNIYKCSLEDFKDKKVDIILSNWMGICLFHERKIESVIFARDNFLKKTGILMPSKSTLCIALIENNEKREDNDEDLDFWKTNGDNHEQNFKKLYNIDISAIHDHAVKEFYTHIISQRLEKKHFISNIVEHHFDLYKLSKKDLHTINLPRCEFQIMRSSLLAGICFYFKVEFKDFEKKHLCTLSTAPGIYNHWKHGIAYFNTLIKIKKDTIASLDINFKVHNKSSYMIKNKLYIGNNRYTKSCITQFEFI